jgi:hypothetical protein
MKKYLLLILASVLSISGYASHRDDGTGATKSGSTWYSTYVSGQYDIQDGNNLDIHFSYPSNQVKFDVYRKSWTGVEKNKKIEIHQYINDSWSVFYTYTVDKHNQWYNGVTTNDLSTNATRIAFHRVQGSEARYIKNVYIKMAHHTKMNTSSISFVNVPVGTTQTQTIDFYSFLSGSNGIQAYIIDNNNNKVNVPGLSLSRTSISANECEKVGENNYSITVTFNPQSIFTLTGYKVRIVNSCSFSSGFCIYYITFFINHYLYYNLSWFSSNFCWWH